MLLEVKNLSVSFPEFTLHPVSFTLERGEILALVGEAGGGRGADSTAAAESAAGAAAEVARCKAS